MRSTVGHRVRGVARPWRPSVGITVVGSALAVGLATWWLASRTLRAPDRRPADRHVHRFERERDVYRSIMEHAPVGLAFSSPDGDFQLINAALRRWGERGGRLPARVRDVPEHLDLHWPDGRKVTPEEYEQLNREAGQNGFEAEARGPGAKSAWCWLSFAPVRAEGDECPLGTVAIVRDISAEHAIRQLREETVAVIAHDLRNPITAMRLSLESALRSRDDQEECVRVPAAALERCVRNAKRLGEMVAELLDAAQVELGKLPLEREEVDLGKFVAELVSDLLPSLRGHEVGVDIAPVPIAAFIDRRRIAQVVTNLLDNASKYARPGTPIRVTLREDDGAALLSVADRGAGISPDALPKLFDRFFQAHRARQQSGGLGLGLYITKGIVDAHGGELTVESVPDVGSTFHVRLPLDPTRQPPRG
jgi:signal transduction histidine kinase